MSIPRSTRPKLIVILGPTASGKSDLAVKLAKKFNGEIVSADSRQVYKEMNIGTAKIAKKGMRGIPHHLINIVKPDESFSLAEYKELAVKTIKKIQKKNKLPFLVGGTGLYIQAIVDNWNIPTVPFNEQIRKKLEKLTIQDLKKRLKKLDPDSFTFVDPKNKRRLIRALEVCLVTGKPFSQQRKKEQPIFDVLQIGVKLDQEKLFAKIDKRIDKMIRVGLIKEVKRLTKKYNPNLLPFSGIGYQEILSYLEGKITVDEARELMRIHIHQYARRQITWFKRDKRIKWVKSYRAAEKVLGLFTL